MMNVLLSERDLAKLSRDQREFLVERLNHVIDNDEKIREIVASRLQETLSLVEPNVKVAAAVKGRGKAGPK